MTKPCASPAHFGTLRAHARAAGGEPGAVAPEPDPPVDARIAGLAAAQHGVVSRGQLSALGLSPAAIDRRVRAGRLHPLHRGVYAVGHRRIGPHGIWRAALLRVGKGAALGFGSAARLWGLWERAPIEPVEVIAPGSNRPQPGIRRHRIHLADDERTVREGLPVTTLARTVYDLASGLRAPELLAVMRDAQFRHRLDPAAVGRISARRPGHRGAGALGTCLHRLGVVPAFRTRSPLEDRFAAFLAAHGLPRGRHNVLVDVGGKMIEADWVCRERRLIVELDGRRAHGSDAAFYGDRARDRSLLAAGWRTVRVTHVDLDDPAALLADLEALLGDESAVDVE